MKIKNIKDLVGGALLVLIAAIMGVGVLELPTGSASRMGPGYFPALLCIILGLLGVAIMLSGFRRSEETLDRTSWRALILVILPIILFGYALRRLGLMPTLGITVFVSSIASQHWNAMQSGLLAIGVAVCGWLIFIKGLGLPIPAIGPGLHPFTDLLWSRAGVALGPHYTIIDLTNCPLYASTISSVFV